MQLEPSESLIKVNGEEERCTIQNKHNSAPLLLLIAKVYLSGLPYHHIEILLRLLRRRRSRRSISIWNLRHRRSVCMV